MEVSWSTIFYSFDSAPMLRVRKCVHQQNLNNGLSIVLTYSILKHYIENIIGRIIQCE